MTAPRPLVTVLCATFNYGQYLGGAVDSVLAQTYENVEMIVVDDGSTDNTSDVLRAYGDSVKGLSVPNAGQNAAFNKAFRESRGDIICLLDADDLMHPEKIETVVSAFEKHPDAEWMFHDLRYVDRATYRELGRPATVSDDLPDPGPHDERARMKRGEEPLLAPATSGLVFRRGLFTRLSPLPELPAFGDHYLKFGAMALARGLVVGERLADQGIHQSNAFTNRDDIRRFRANRMINVAHHLEVLDGAIWRFCDRMTVEGLYNSFFGLGLGEGERRYVSEMLRNAGVKRSLLLLMAVARVTIRRGSMGAVRRAERGVRRLSPRLLRMVGTNA